MSVGDVNSNARGSGARYNSGKPDLSLIPLTIIARAYDRDTMLTANEKAWVASLRSLGLFQTTGLVAHLDNAIELVSFAWRDAAHVFEYGKQKYAPWNWAKGMAWSITLACAGRHFLKHMEDDEVLDDESGHSHVGHYLCNLVMARHFFDCFPEGNDLPPPEVFALPAPASQTPFVPAASPVPVLLYANAITAGNPPDDHFA